MYNFDISAYSDKFRTFDFDVSSAINIYEYVCISSNIGYCELLATLEIPNNRKYVCVSPLICEP